MFVEVPWRDIEIIKDIGFGRDGDVHVALWTKGNAKEEIAVKILKNKIENDDDTPTDPDREINNLRRVKHDNIVKIFGICNDFNIDRINKKVILMEYAACGSLHDVLFGKKKNKKISLLARCNWMHQLAQVLAYLHSIKIMHRDLKPDNLLLTNNYRKLLLSDFGTVKQNVTAEKNTVGVGTYGYMAPETQTDDYTYNCDVFSFGFVLFETISRQKAFENMATGPKVQIQIENNVRPNMDKILQYAAGEHYKQIIEMCWDKDAEKRPTMAGLAFILGIDLSSLKGIQLLSIHQLPEPTDDDFPNE